MGTWTTKKLIDITTKIGSGATPRGGVGYRECRIGRYRYGYAFGRNSRREISRPVSSNDGQHNKIY